VGPRLVRSVFVVTVTGLLLKLAADYFTAG
jgi:hypothetical protein